VTRDIVDSLGYSLTALNFYWSGLKDQLEMYKTLIY